MRRDLPRRGPIGMQQAGGGAMQRVARIACQRGLDRIADNRMDEPRRIVGRQHLQTNETRGQRDRLRHLHAGDRRRVAQLAAVPEHRERLREAQRARMQPPHPGQHPPRHPLAPAGHQLGRIELGQRPVLELDRPQQLGQVERIAAARRPHRRAQLARSRRRRERRGRSRRPRPRSTAPAAPPSAPRRAAPQATLPSRPARQAEARRAAPPPAPQAAGRGEPTSAARARPPNARHRRRSAAAGGPRG